jgi:hypothetical protein
MAGQRAVTGKNVFWIASILAILLLGIHITVFTQITQYNANDLGLLTKLPITFWIGLSYLGVLLCIGRKSRLQTIIVVVLICFYLFGIPVLTRENKAEFLGISYFFSSLGTRLLSVGHIEFGSIDMLSPLNWPGFFILAGIISAATGLQATVFADYFPLLTIALLGILVYKTLRLQLSILQSSFGALWFVASFWTAQNYFSPQGVAYIIYFAIFFLLAKLFFERKQNMAIPVIVLVLFIALVSTHLLTSFVVAGGVIGIYALFRIFPLKRKMVAFYSIVTCVLFISIFIAYQALIITKSFSGIADLLFSQFSQGDTHLAVISQGRTALSPALQLNLLGSYGITIINLVIVVTAILITAVLILLHKKEAKNNLFWIAWIIIAGMIGLSVAYGGEAIIRAFILLLLPASYFAAKFFGRKPRILIFILIIIVFLQIPAHYGNSNYNYVPTSELKGTAFFAKYAPANTVFFYEPGLASFGTGRLTGLQLDIVAIVGTHSLPTSELVNYTIGTVNFILYSSEEKNLYQYFYGFDPLENLSLDDHYDRLYDNEGFKIYARLGG